MKKKRLKKVRDAILSKPDNFHMDTFSGVGDSGCIIQRPGFCGTSHCIAGITVKLFEPDSYERIIKSDAPEFGFRATAARILGLDVEEADKLFYPYPQGSPSGNGWSDLPRRLYYESTATPEDRAQITAEVIENFMLNVEDDYEKDFEAKTRREDDYEEDDGESRLTVREGL